MMTTEHEYRNRSLHISQLQQDPSIEESTALETSLQNFQGAQQKVQEARSQLEAHLCEKITPFQVVLDTVIKDMA